MTLSVYRYGLALFALLLAFISVQAQQARVQSMTYKLDSAGLNISFGLDQNATSLAGPELNFRTYKDSVLVKSGVSDPTLLQGKFLSFSIAPIDADNAKEIEFYVSVKIATGGQVISSQYNLNLEDARSLKAAQERVNSLTSENGKLKGTI